jgi:hypothetical protein
MVLVLAGLMVAPPCGARAAAAGSSDCAFHSVNGRWQGSCGRLFDATPVMTLAPEKAIATGAWRKGMTPTAVWAGDMTDDGNRNWPIELEIYPGATGVLRTEYGWFPVSDFSAAASTLRFQLDASHEVPPSGLDRQIVQRAAELLASDAVWNRADNRRCPASATTWSIYCAVERATIDVTGAANHRRPAMEVVRVAVEKRAAGRNYHHRLMDYNNDPSTRIDDVRSLFAEVLAQDVWVQ